MKEKIGQRLGSYVLTAFIGKGNSGAVFQAARQTDGRIVAVKVISPQIASKPRFENQFEDVTKAAIKLNHPGIVKTIEAGSTTGAEWYIVMEFVPGSNLGAYLAQLVSLHQVINLEESVMIARQATMALAAAHQQGVWHGNLRPNNLLLSEAKQPDPLRILLTDFGLTKLLESSSPQVTVPIFGDPMYFSPERCLGQPVDGRSDIYAMGLILYQLVTGSKPFIIRSAAEAYQRHVNEELSSPRTLRPELSGQVESIVLTATAKKPEARFQTAAAMAEALQAVEQDHIQVEASPTVSTTSIHLVTELLLAVPPSPSNPVGNFPDGTAQGDQLYITRSGGPPEIMPLTKPLLTIGRANENDLILSEPAISLRHARLEKISSGWQIVDLNSTNGVYLDESRLLPDVPQVWNPGKEVRLGSVFLRWQPGSAGLPVAPAADKTAIQVHTSSATIEPSRSKIRPGEFGVVQVALFNGETVVHHFQPEVQGLPSAWITMSQKNIRLMPGSQAGLTITISLPKNSNATAGLHHYTLRVKSAGTGQTVATAEGTVEVAPYFDFHVDALRSQVRLKEPIRLLLENAGNLETLFSIRVDDPTQAVIAKRPSTQVSLGPGQRDTIEVALEAQKRPFFGRSELTTFDLIVDAAQNKAQRISGQVVIPPRISIWSIVFLLILFSGLCLAAAGTTGYERWQTRNGQATQQAMIQLGTAASVETATQAALAILTQEFNLQATEVAGTATAQAAYLTNDNDNDGLTNSEELEQQTDLNNPDTDGDGLTDGDEVKIYKTHPRIKDSDSDGLDDGDEITKYCTDPTNPDSDEDDIRDGVEITAGSNPRGDQPCSGSHTTEEGTAPLPSTAQVAPTPRFDNFRSCDRPCDQSGAIEQSVFPERTNNIYVAWDYHNMAPGTPYSRIWLAEGLEWVRYQCFWQGPSDGVFTIALHDEFQGLRSGTWTLILTINAEEVLRETVFVEGTFSGVTVNGLLSCPDW